MQSLKRKGEKYSRNQQKKIFLLIDLNPGGINRDSIERIKELLQPELQKVSFKQIWLVGSTNEQLLRLL